MTTNLIPTGALPATVARRLAGHRALACCSDFVVVDPRGREVMTLSRNALGTTYAHAVHAAYERVADAITRADLPFDDVRAAGKVEAADGGDYVAWEV